MKILWVLYLISGNAVQLTEFTKESKCVEAMEYARDNAKGGVYLKFVCVPVLLDMEQGEP